jgi:hypothetical protein
MIIIINYIIAIWVLTMCRDEMFWYFADSCYLGFDNVQGWNVLIFCSNILAPPSQQFNSFGRMLNWWGSEIMSQRPQYFQISHCLKTWEYLFLEFYMPAVLREICAFSNNFVAMVGRTPSKLPMQPTSFSSAPSLYHQPAAVQWPWTCKQYTAAKFRTFDHCTV